MSNTTNTTTTTNTNTTTIIESIDTMPTAAIAALTAEEAARYTAALEEAAKAAAEKYCAAAEKAEKAEKAVEKAFAAMRAAKKAEKAAAAEEYCAAAEEAEKAAEEAAKATEEAAAATERLDNFRWAYNRRYAAAITAFATTMEGANTVDLVKRALSAHRANRGTAVSVAMALANPSRYTGADALKNLVEDVTAFMAEHADGKGRAIKGNCSDHNTLRGAVALAGILTGEPVAEEDFYSALTKEK